MEILVIKPSSLGDVIHALPFLSAVKETFPDSRVDWVISRNIKGIIEDSPLINSLIVLDKDSWKRIRNIPKTLAEISKLRKALKAKHYDIVVDLQGLLRSGLISLSAPSTMKIGFTDAREGSRLCYDRKISVGKNIHAVDKCLAVAEAIGAQTNRVKFHLHVDSAAKKTVKRLLGGINDYIVVAPSARWETKRWPAHNFAKLISNTVAPCVITGTKSDNKIAVKILDNLSDKRKKSGKTINLCGKTGLKELTALIAGAKAVVTNDSGPMHIAAALNKPVIAVFGPTDPNKTGPYGWEESDKMSVIRAGVPCSPCRKRKCDDLKCMNNVSVRSVSEALKKHS
jgi:heptosyltransferase-1